MGKALPDELVEYVMENCGFKPPQARIILLLISDFEGEELLGHLAIHFDLWGRDYNEILEACEEFNFDLKIPAKH